ncbi:MAG: hypothetical protein LQ338_004302 [Usnochroma carphineum]|nr:MAG: hypothetical protein LQ338_004302 [Usnochroma carphineum]
MTRAPQGLHPSPLHQEYHRIKFHSAFKSPVFEILVGPSAESFYAHADVLSKSKVLKKEVDGLWKESSERKIYWRDWTVSAVEKFLEWLYTGDYVCPYPVKASRGKSSQQKSASDGKDEDNRRPDDDPDLLVPEAEERRMIKDAKSLIPSPPQYSRQSASDPTSSTKKRKLPEAIPPRSLTRLQDLTWNGCRTLRERLSQAGEYDKWTGHQLWRPDKLDYEATFLTHAELYAMANQYMLDDLKNIAWQRLRSVLVSIGKPTPWSPVVDNVVALIHCVYEHTGDVGEEEEPLRMLVNSFVALHFTSFQGSEVGNLMLSKKEADREFVLDLMNKMAQQMAYMETKEDKKKAQRSKTHA